MDKEQIIKFEENIIKFYIDFYKLNKNNMENYAKTVRKFRDEYIDRIRDIYQNLTSFRLYDFFDDLEDIDDNERVNYEFFENHTANDILNCFRYFFFAENIVDESLLKYNIGLYLLCKGSRFDTKEEFLKDKISFTVLYVIIHQNFKNKIKNLKEFVDNIVTEYYINKPIEEAKFYKNYDIHQKKDLNKVEKYLENLGREYISNTEIISDDDIKNIISNISYEDLSSIELEICYYHFTIGAELGFIFNRDDMYLYYDENIKKYTDHCLPKLNILKEKYKNSRFIDEMYLICKNSFIPQTKSAEFDENLKISLINYLKINIFFLKNKKDILNSFFMTYFKQLVQNIWMDQDQEIENLFNEIINEYLPENNIIKSEGCNQRFITEDDLLNLEIAFNTAQNFDDFLNLI